jgi:hypothetical protein
VRVWDAENSIYDGLRALPKRSYLCAMWILCGELRSLFGDRLSDSERSLMTSTLDTVREVVITDEAAPGIASGAAELAVRWEGLIIERENEVLPGQWNAWVTFENLSAELAGTLGQYEATERLTLAATDRWREPYRGKARRIDPDEEVEDTSPMARTLATFQRVVTGIAQMPESQWDPEVVRAQVLG